MVITRKQFKAVFNKRDSRLGGPKSALWIPEDAGVKSNWFVSVRPLSTTFRQLIIDDNITIKQSYWEWVNQNCSGQVRCYSSDPDNEEEWWGFENKDDIIFWMLRWA